MRRIPIEIAKSLNFTGRLNSNERKVNVTLQSSPGTVWNSRHDLFLHNLGGFARRLTTFAGRLYALNSLGGLFSNTDLIDFGYGDGSFFVATSQAVSPTTSINPVFLFVAGQTKMRKVSTGNVVSNWGIAPPPFGFLGTFLAGGSSNIIGRYAYQYLNGNTGQRSTRNNPTPVFNSGGANVLLSGFTPSPDPQVTHQIVLRDVSGDGVFREVGYKPNDANTFTDVFANSDLTNNPVAVDLNTHGTPPLADLAVFWRGSVWLNDRSNPRRMWASVPGKMESFTVAGAFDIGEIGDEIKAAGVVAGNLYIWAQSRVYLVSGQYPLFTFDAIAELGCVGRYAISLTTDKAVFMSNGGVYEFNGATFKPLPDIWTLCDPDSHDGRRFTGRLLNDVVVGSDNRHTWVGWTQIDLVRVMYKFSHFTQTWTEHNPQLSVVAPALESFYSLGGYYDGSVLQLNSDQHRGAFILTTPELEFDLSRFLSIDVDYVGGPCILKGFVDGQHVGTTEIPASGIRTTANFPFAENVFGRRIYVSISQFVLGDTGIADLTIYVDELPTAVQLFDTGEVPISHNPSEPLDLIVHLVAPKLLSIDGQLFIDGRWAHGWQIPNIGPGFVGPLRFVVPPFNGRSARVVLRGSDFFCVLKIALRTAPLGDETVKEVELGGTYPAQLRKSQQALNA